MTKLAREALIATPRVVEAITASERRLLELLERDARIEVGLVQSRTMDSERLLWLLAFGLIGVEVDPSDRVYLTKTSMGAIVLEELFERSKNDPRGT